MKPKHVTRLAILHALCTLLPAQVVRVANYGALPSTGWVRTTIDRLPAHPAGRVGSVEFVVGRPIGVSTWAVDVRTEVAPGQQLSIDLIAGLLRTVRHG